MDAMRLLRGRSRARRWVLGLCATALLPLPAGARAGALGRGLEEALAGVGRDVVTSGFLLDRTLPLARMERFDGTAAAPVAGPGALRQIVDELWRARVDGMALPDAALPTAADLRARGRAAGDAGVIPIAVVDVTVQRIRDGADRDGAVTTEGGRLRVAARALESRRVFAASALVGETRRGDSARFVLPGDLWIAPGGARPVRLRVDADDGSGWHDVRPDVPFGPRWDRTGRRVLALEATFPGGTTRTATFAFDVVRLATPAPDDTLLVSGAEAWGGSTATGKAYVALAPGHAVLENPVVVIEGFDLDDSMGWDRLYELLNQENLLEDLRAQGFDAVVLDFDSATEPIQRNALVVAQLLQDVAAAIPAERTTFLVGASMGGLCARHALLWLSAHAVDTRVRTYLSFDAPHGGANIPLGLQYWLDFFSDQSADAAYLLSRLDTPAARQLLVAHHTTPPSAAPAADPLRPAFLADLASLGDWPAGPRRVAVANGSGSAMGQGFAPAAQIVRYEYRSFLVDIDGNVWAVPDGSSAEVFHGEIDFILLPADQLSVVVSGTPPWDNAPGGNRDSMFQMDTTAAPYGDIVALYDRHCFIPTVSALALPGGDLFFDVAGTPDVASLTPFAAVTWAPANEEHVFISPATKAWVMDEVLAAPTAVPGPAIASSSPGLTLRGAFPNPFRDAVTVRFALGGPAPVSLDVYDVAGRLVQRVLEGERRSAGEQAARWRAPAAGVYFFRLRAGSDAATGRALANP